MVTDEQVRLLMSLISKGMPQAAAAAKAVRRMTAEWITRYNELRPHESLGDVPPRRYLMAQSR